MTQAERTALQKLINETTTINNRRNECFKELQIMSKECGLPMWCCAKTNRDQLQQTDFARKADCLYEEYLVLGGKDDMLMKFGRTLAELGFWKKKEARA